MIPNDSNFDVVMLCLAAMVMFSAGWILRGVTDAVVVMLTETVRWLRTQREATRG